MKCESCDHTIASDSPVWCAECHGAEVAHLNRGRREAWESVSAARQSQLLDTISTLTRERDEARGDVERLRAALTAAHEYAPHGETCGEQCNCWHRFAAAALYQRHCDRWLAGMRECEQRVWQVRREMGWSASQYVLEAGDEKPEK